MVEDEEDFAEWIEDFYEEERADQVERMKWLHETRANPAGGHVFRGGITASNLYEEAQQAYLFGLFQSCMITSLAVVEQELIGLLYGAGDDDIKSGAAAAAIDEAADQDLISPEEKEVLHQIRKVRNPTTHFRHGVNEDSLRYRAVESETPPAELAEKDARMALSAMFTVVERTGAVDGEPEYGV